MDLRKLQRVIVDALDDIKAQDIKVFNTTDQTELFDRVIIASGTSNRQTRSLASHVRDKVKEAGGQLISVEGEESGEWVLVDLGDAVVHIMQPAIRAYYRLEELWGAKPVNVRIGPAETAAPSPRKVTRTTRAKSEASPQAGSKTQATTSAKAAPRKAASTAGKPRAARPAPAAKAAARPAAKKRATASKG